MLISHTRLEVMQTLEKELDVLLKKYLKSVEENWQPADLLPDSMDDDFHEQIEEIQGNAQEMSYELLAVLIGDMITEEALPTYESWLVDVVGIDQHEKNAWAQWVRSWTAEENRHGDLLNKYLYLSGRVNMQVVEKTIQYLISDGFDIGTSRDPYKNFIYTSFQELATNISHRRVATLVKKSGNKALSKMCGVIAADEARHANAYMHFVELILELDPNELLIALEEMMRFKIVMPAHMMRTTDKDNENLYEHFSNSAQRLGVYTTQDYIDILRSLLDRWKIADCSGLNEKATKAQDYLMRLPDRLQRISDRVQIPQTSYHYNWIHR
ncbi:MAG: acyl-ACP desaturase [Saprospiraceae bacterium]|nr:acyl-ACP desaturase [Saprospiraceae bacterium]